MHLVELLKCWNAQAQEVMEEMKAMAANHQEEGDLTPSWKLTELSKF